VAKKDFVKLARRATAGSRCVWVLSGLPQTRVPEMNRLVAKMNKQMKGVAEEYGWSFAGNDSVQQMDLRDDVHLNKMGALKLQRKMCYAIRVACGKPHRIFL
jgi:hypothetical protein